MNAPQPRVRRWWSVQPGLESEARVSMVFVAAAAAIFVIALALVPPFPVTFDEAKYLGIGFSMVEGHGPQIVFGSYFLLHAPVWPTVVVAPAVALATDPLIVGRFLNALSGLGLILLSAALGWRIRPAAAAFAAIGLVATTYLWELTRTSRLDVPSATLAVAYVALGLVAVRRGSTRYAIAAGMVFGAAFLVKEIVLPLAPVPVLAAVLHRQPWRPILRTAGWLTLSGAIVLAPWFIFVADLGGRVYRLGTPGWTLLPIGLAVLGVGLAGVIASRLPVPPVARGIADRLEGSIRTWAVAGFTILWVLALTVFFGRTLASRGTAIIDVPQIVAYVRTWYPYLVTTAVGVVGLGLSIPAWRAAEGRPRAAIEDMWLATICGLPLMILVIGVGEPPRNYLAQLAIGAGLAAAGWLWLLEATIRRARSPRSDAGTTSRWTERAIVGLLIVSLLGASAALVVTDRLHRPVPTRDDAVATVAPWVRAHVPRGSTIAFGSYLGYEMALPLRADFTPRQVRHVLVVGDVDAPDGITVFGKPALDDWVSIDIAPKNVNEFQAFSAGTFIAQLRKSGAEYWVYSTGTTTAAPTIIPALEGAAGFEQIAHWAFARPRGVPIETYVYRLDLELLAIDTDRILVAPDALERMVALIEREGAAALAGRLATQVVAAPRTDATDALLERLWVLGQPIGDVGQVVGSKLAGRGE
jgi:4-amino-4-deoxy-L-arabinose transferase-like glycosyltransferase